jgi:hypothetical protein
MSASTVDRVSVLIPALFSDRIKPGNILEAWREPVQIINLLPVQRALVET